jgi:cytochrome c5
MRIFLVCSVLLAMSLPLSALAADLDKGKAVYDSSCAMCHNAGIAGSPKLDDKAAWKSRLAKGEAVLIENSIKGFKGNSGFMPAKGGKTSLSDDDVTNAVHYIISKVK